MGYNPELLVTSITSQSRHRSKSSAPAFLMKTTGSLFGFDQVTENGEEDVPFGELSAAKVTYPDLQARMDRDFSDIFDDFDSISTAHAACARMVNKYAVDILEEAALEVEYNGCEFPRSLVIIDNVHVEPELRGHGLAKCLLQEFQDSLAGESCIIAFLAHNKYRNSSLPSDKLIEIFWKMPGIALMQPDPDWHPEFFVGVWSGDELFDRLDSDEPNETFVQIYPGCADRYAKRLAQDQSA